MTFLLLVSLPFLLVTDDDDAEMIIITDEVMHMWNDYDSHAPTVVTVTAVCREQS